MTEVTGTVSTTFLGLTVGCARCHDHKIDPIPQDDYYRLQAFFDAAEPASLALAPAASQKRWQEENARVQKVITDLEEQRQALLKPARERLQKTTQAMPSDKEVQAALSGDEKRELSAVARQLLAARNQLPPALASAWGIHDAGRLAPACVRRPCWRAARVQKRTRWRPQQAGDSKSNTNQKLEDTKARHKAT